MCSLHVFCSPCVKYRLANFAASEAFNNTMVDLFQLGWTVAGFIALGPLQAQTWAFIPDTWFFSKQVLYRCSPALTVCCILLGVCLSSPAGFSGSSTYLQKNRWSPGELLGVQLGPAIISLAFSTHAALRKYAVAPHVLLVTLVMSLASYYIAALVGVCLGLPPTLRLSSIFHSVSPAVAVPARGLVAVGGVKCIPSVVAASAICTGILAQLTYPSMLALPCVGSRSAVVRGATVGTVGLVLGAIPMRQTGEEEAFGIAALAYIGMAIWGGIWLLVTPVMDPLLNFVAYGF